MLKGIMHLRKIVRAELVGSTLDSFWVADPVGSLLDSDLLRPVTSTELSHYLGGDCTVILFFVQRRMFISQLVKFYK